HSRRGWNRSRSTRPTWISPAAPHPRPPRRLQRRPRDPPSRSRGRSRDGSARRCALDRKSTRLNSSHVKISYAVFCLKKKNYVTMKLSPIFPSCYKYLPLVKRTSRRSPVHLTLV